MSEQIQKANIKVAGSYDPETVTFKQGVPAELTFTRKNQKPFYEKGRAHD